MSDWWEENTDASTSRCRYSNQMLTATHGWCCAWWRYPPTSRPSVAWHHASSTPRLARTSHPLTDIHYWRNHLGTPQLNTWYGHAFERVPTLDHLFAPLDEEWNLLCLFFQGKTLLKWRVMITIPSSRTLRDGIGGGQRRNRARRRGECRPAIFHSSSRAMKRWSRELLFSICFEFEILARRHADLLFKGFNKARCVAISQFFVNGLDG